MPKKKLRLWCGICGKTIYVKAGAKNEDLYCESCKKTLDFCNEDEVRNVKI